MPPTDAALLTGFRLRHAERNLGVHGIHLHREGHEPVEPRFRGDDTVEVYSPSTTFVAVAVGIAHAEAWRADGKYGRFSVVLPRQRAVVSVTAHREGAADDILRAVWEELLPQLPTH